MASRCCAAATARPTSKQRVAATPQTNYRLASVTKQFTAASILLLAEDGKLSLDDPLRKWLPSLPAATDPITLRHLLTHTSGLIDYEDVMAPDATAQVHDIDVLHLLETQDRTVFRAGHQLSLQQQRLFAAGADRRQGLRARISPRSCTTASSSRSA